MDLLTEFLRQVGALQQFWMPFAVMLVVSWIVIWRILKHHYQGRLDTKDEVIRLEEKRVQDYKDKLSGATPDAAKARMDALEERLDALGPRRITAEQRQRMLPELDAFRGSTVQITADAASADAAQLSNGFAAAFNAAGWRVETGIGFGLGQPAPSGIGLFVGNAAALTPTERAIADAFRAAGLEFDFLHKGGPTQDREGNPMELIALSNRLDA